MSLIKEIFNEDESLFEKVKQYILLKEVARRYLKKKTQGLFDLDLSQRKFDVSYFKLSSDTYQGFCSGRSKLDRSVLNDVYRSIPSGSEDVKSDSYKKFNFEESLFKIEDSKYETDLIISRILSLLGRLKFLLENIKSISSPFTINCLFKHYQQKIITGAYKEGLTQLQNALANNPEETLQVLSNRFTSIFEGLLEQKASATFKDRQIVDKSYPRAFDYRSAKFRASEKKENTIKSFITQIINRSKLKMNSSNLNLMVGGSEVSPIYNTSYISLIQKIQANFNNQEFLVKKHNRKQGTVSRS